MCLLKRTVLGGLFLAFAMRPMVGQSVDDLNLQFHGYATQGFLYTTNNNILTADSSDGSAAWTEAVVNVTSTPIPKLRVGIQARYSLIGTEGNTITLDWAAADYKVNERFGVRFGKVKSPLGLYNEVQDIDPAYMWCLLPQGSYQLLSRNSELAHFGGDAYGALPLGEHLGKLKYNLWAGEIVISPDDGYFRQFKNNGVGVLADYSATSEGVALRWATPLRGLMLGSSNLRVGSATVPATIGPITGSFTTRSFYNSDFFGQYERKAIMVAGEYLRHPIGVTVDASPLPSFVQRLDARTWYAMATYRVRDRLIVGAYQSQWVDHAQVLAAARTSKDWTVSARYDFNQFLYAKAEQHFIRGTGVDYDLGQNAGGLKPNTHLTVLKLGVSF